MLRTWWGRLRCFFAGHRWRYYETEIKYPHPIYGWHYFFCRVCDKHRSKECCKNYQYRYNRPPLG